MASWIPASLNSYVSDEETFILNLSYLFLILSGITALALLGVTAPYGRYSREGWGFYVPSKIAWTLQELPSFCVPLLVAIFTECPKSSNTLNRFAFGLFLLHYGQRSLIFPLLIKGGKPTPVSTFLMAFAFCCINGYMQGCYLLKFADLEWTLQTSPWVVTGTVIFFIGMIINIHSDSVLRNLRKEGETGYKIPQGGLFTYVSGANYLGEIIEWFGFALLNRTLPAFSFAVFTLSNIGPRALQHHRWYKEKFKEYPKDRKALIPYIL